MPYDLELSFGGGMVIEIDHGTSDPVRPTNPRAIAVHMVASGHHAHFPVLSFSASDTDTSTLDPLWPFLTDPGGATHRNSAPDTEGRQTALTALAGFDVSFSLSSSETKFTLTWGTGTAAAPTDPPDTGDWRFMDWSLRSDHIGLVSIDPAKSVSRIDLPFGTLEPRRVILQNAPSQKAEVWKVLRDDGKAPPDRKQAIAEQACLRAKGLTGPLKVVLTKRLPPPAPMTAQLLPRLSGPLRLGFTNLPAPAPAGPLSPFEHLDQYELIGTEGPAGIVKPTPDFATQGSFCPYTYSVK